jgi:hypothetical protein
MSFWLLLPMLLPMLSIASIVVWIVDPHSHTCVNKHRWWHFGIGRHRSAKSHTCKTCGMEAWER